MSIQVFIAGDSTAAEKLPEKRPESGWGEHVQPLFREGVAVRNHAINGRSTKSFMDQGRLTEVEAQLRPGDYLFIQFGHNDQKSEDPERYASLDGAYQDNLRVYIETARRKGATPVLLTSITRRDFVDGILSEDTIQGYPAAMRQVAAAENVAVLDIYQITHAWVKALGDEESRNYFLHLAPGEHSNYPDGVADNTHLNAAGAVQVAKLVAQALIQSKCKLKEWLQ